MFKHLVGLWFAHLAIGGVRMAAAAQVRGTIIDADTGRAVAARLTIRDADGKWYFPKPAVPEGTAIEYKRQVSPTSLEMHTTLSAYPFVVEVPPGKYQFHVERGKEYMPVDREVVVGEEAVEVKLTLTRWINMAKQGWYSGDVHLHRALDEVPNLVLAEDLNVAFPLSHWVTTAETGPIKGNRIPSAVPAPEPILVDATHLIYPLNTEFEIFTIGKRPHTLGAVLILGQRTIVDEGVPPVGKVAKQAHAEGAYLDLEKHSWAWSPTIVPVMQVEFFELANNHCWPSEFAFHSWTLDMKGDYMGLETNDKGFTEWGWIDFGFKTYYAFLNCGLKLRPTAGTGSGVHPVPAGFGRVYVEVEEPFTVKRWLDGLNAGRSFVTTGPMLRTQVNGRPDGEGIRSEGPQRLKITGRAESAAPLDRIEIIVNGDVRHTLKPDNKPTENKAFISEIDQEIMADRTCWVAVRAFEQHPQKRIRFAHGSPIHIEIGGKPIRPKPAEVEYFISRVQREIDRNTGVLNAPALEEHQTALRFYKGLLPSKE